MLIACQKAKKEVKAKKKDNNSFIQSLNMKKKETIFYITFLKNGFLETNSSINKKNKREKWLKK